MKCRPKEVFELSKKEERKTRSRKTPSKKKNVKLPARKKAPAPSERGVSKEAARKAVKVLRKSEKPEPVVRGHFSLPKLRPGKGFSPSELKKSGLDLLKARQLRLPIDYRRGSDHSENIKRLRDWLGKNG